MAHFLSKERIVAGPGFNRWLVPPAALGIHLCIGMAYGFSVFWKPLQGALVGADGQPLEACAAGATTFGEKIAGLVRSLTATDCNWTQFDLGWMYTLFFVVLGCSAAMWGAWIERVGPRKVGMVAMLCWCGGLLVSAYGVYVHQLWLMWLGSGVIGGIGLGLGYISPVSTLIKWFPDRRGMATGMAIMGFGGGALIGSPFATLLMAQFASPGEVGVWQTFVVLALIYAAFMSFGALLYRVPPTGWRPEGWTPAPTSAAMIATGHVHLRNAHRTPQFWLLWVVLCMNVSAGIGIIGAAAPMMQETFGGTLIDRPELDWADVRSDEALRNATAVIAASFVGLISLFNIFGRIAWASSSDTLGRKQTYVVFFVLGAALYVVSSLGADWKSLALLVSAFCIIASMYGGGFATIPAYLADMFGTQFVGAIHGRLLTAWSTAGILGPVVVNYMHDMRVEAQVPFDQVYGPIFLSLAGMLLVGLLANLLVRPVAEKWFMSEHELAAETQLARAGRAGTGATAEADPSVIGARGSLSIEAVLAWTVIGIPLAWGVWITVIKALPLFG